MSAKRITAIATVSLCGWSGFARAQSAPTCSFDAAAAAVTVTVNGDGAHLRALVSTGEITLNGVACGGATVLNTDSIQVVGGALPDEVSLAGVFAPGLTPEVSGGSEIEISFDLGALGDVVTINLTQQRDVITFTSDGIDVGSDLDRDILTAGVELISLFGSGGNDRIDASAYTSLAQEPYATIVSLHGGTGQDRLIGASLLPNYLHGDEDADNLYGGYGGDLLWGGSGDDAMFGRGGGDTFYAEPTLDGADEMRGGDGTDQVDYDRRANGVSVTIGNGQADDGEPSEGDEVGGDVETVRGGKGPNVLVGNFAANQLFGGAAADELYGGGGDDDLRGGGGADLILGDGGNDQLLGDSGPDILHGGLGDDRLVGYGGGDEYFGEGGNDLFFNADGFADSVDCGAGAADNAEPDPLDTFTGCEL